MPRRPYYPGYYGGEESYYGYGYGAYGAYGYPGYPPGRGRAIPGARPVAFVPSGRGRMGPGRFPGRAMMPPDAYYGAPPPYAIAPTEYREGRGAYGMPGRPPFERRPPPGTPGVSSGYQVRLLCCVIVYIWCIYHNDTILCCATTPTIGSRTQPAVGYDMAAAA